MLNALISVVFKLFQKYKIENLQAIVVNYFVCVATAAVVKGGNPIPSDVQLTPWFVYAILLGILFVAAFNIMALTVQNFGVMIATIFQKMSLIAPTLIAIIWYGETASPMKWLGILAALVSIILISYQKKYKQELNPDKASNVKNWIWILPILTFLGACIIDSSLFLIEQNKLAAPGDVGFLASLFLSAGLNGLLILTFSVVRGKSKLAFRNVIAGICLGIPNFFSIYLLLLALQQGFEGSVVFPITNVGVLVLASLFGLLIFKEQLTRLKMIGFGLAIASILLISFS